MAHQQIADRTPRHHLLPSALKVRNLQSLSLRNLQLSPRARGNTIRDDDALPNSLNSPAKLLALREENVLGHSRSSSDLRGDVAEDDEGRKDAGKCARRPSARKLRRRSTIEWINATPTKRQQRLEAVTRERMGDVFFSLHVGGVEEPIYVSEMVERSMNPTFGSIDWTCCGPGITRLEDVIVRVWAKGSESEQWVQLLQLGVEMRGLCYLGKDLANITRSLPPNALIFHLPDGVYTTPTNSLFPSPQQLKSEPSSRTVRQLPTSSFDALLRLQKLSDSIQDALTTRNQIATDLENLLQTNKQALNDQDTLSEALDRLKTIDYAKSTVSKQLSKALAQQAEKRASLAARQALMKKDQEVRIAQQQEISSTRPLFPGLRETHLENQKAIQNQRRRICEDLQTCYPIHPLSNKPLAFSIRGLHLPNSEDLDAEPPEKVSAALGHVSHALQLLSFYLSQPLPYPVTPRGSTSTISDPISILKTSGRKKGADMARIYPLFSKGVPRFRFEYAVFLLNQNVRVVLESAYGLKVMDVRQMLPNLKYLLFVATAGEGEVVGRKAGGVRGLIRRGSQDSVGSGVGRSGSQVGGVNGKGRGAEERLRELRVSGGAVRGVVV